MRYNPKLFSTRLRFIQPGLYLSVSPDHTSYHFTYPSRPYCDRRAITLLEEALYEAEQGNGGTSKQKINTVLQELYLDWSPSADIGINALRLVEDVKGSILKIHSEDAADLLNSDPCDLDGVFDRVPTSLRIHLQQHYFEGQQEMEMPGRAVLMVAPGLDEAARILGDKVNLSNGGLASPALAFPSLPSLTDSSSTPDEDATSTCARQVPPLRS